LEAKRKEIIVHTRVSKPSFGPVHTASSFDKIFLLNQLYLPAYYICNFFLVYAIFPSLLILKEEEAGAAFYICNHFVEYAPKQAYLILYFQQKFLKANQTVLPRHEECEKPAF
jgi:hypothetical protein